MWRRPLNSVISTTTVHKEPEKMPDGTCIQVKVRWLTSVQAGWSKRKLYNVKDSAWRGDREKLGRRREKELLYHQLSEIVNSIIIHLFGPWFHLVLCLFLGLFILQIFTSRYPIREEPSFSTYSLQIYCIGHIGLVSQSYWAWALNRDPTITNNKKCTTIWKNSYFL